jgi:hypothetical protein
MKRSLLIGSALVAAISAYPQSTARKTPSGVLESKFKRYDLVEGTSQNNASVFSGPAKLVKHKTNSQFKTTTSVCNQFTGSMNVLGYLLSQE